MAYDEPVKADREMLIERVVMLEKRLIELHETVAEQASLLNKVAREVGH